jgi:tetratricopeptide (TPR) repeat protein
MISSVSSYLDKAVLVGRRLLKLWPRVKNSQDWAMTQNNLGTALSNQGERSSGEESRKLLSQAVAAHKQALEVYTREELPQDCADTQTKLCITLSYQAAKVTAVEAKVLLGEALQRMNDLVSHQPSESNHWYNLACIHALLKETSKALSALEKAVILSSGKYCTMAKSDSDFASVINIKEFQEFFTTKCNQG